MTKSNKIIFYLALFLLSNKLFADFDTLTVNANTQIQTAETTIAEAMETLALRYFDADSKTALATTKISFSDDKNPIDTIVSGYIPSYSSPTCPPSLSSGTDSNLDENGNFTICLTDNYLGTVEGSGAGHLAIEVRFKSSTTLGSISGALDNKKVLFVAKGPGMQGTTISKNATWSDDSSSSTENITPEGMGSIGSFTCYNPEGVENDGINNGGALGTIYVNENLKLPIKVKQISKLGGIGKCL